MWDGCDEIVLVELVVLVTLSGLVEWLMVVSSSHMIYGNLGDVESGIEFMGGDEFRSFTVQVCTEDYV